MPWIIVVITGLFEIAWAAAIKPSHGFTRLGPSVVTVVAILASFGLLSMAMRALPLGTAYAVWTGIDAVGAFAAGILFLGESASPLRLLAVALSLAGIVLIKLATP